VLLEGDSDQAGPLETDSEGERPFQAEEAGVCDTGQRTSVLPRDEMREMDTAREVEESINNTALPILSHCHLPGLSGQGACAWQMFLRS
jgi:hypothetical protein